jgi:SAM-dependent methyltransferase
MYEHLSGYTDPGERAALERVAVEARDRPILDLGVGAGRTIPLLRAISHDYLAVDYTPALVTVCRARHPGVDVRVGDARDLSQLASGSFFLVVFSWNGIDSVDHAGRLAILREIHRVLMPSGICVFSAHNHDGPVNRPERYHPPRLSVSANPLKLAVRTQRYLRHLALGLYNRRRNRALEQRSAEYSVANSGAHEYGLMIHHIQLGLQVRQLEALGFERIEALSCVDGHVVTAHEDTSAITWFHFIARKPAH